MRRKILQDHANTLCQMLVGWRMGDDVTKLGSLGTGNILIDILKRNCTHNGISVDGLFIVDELNAWFSDQLITHNISSDKIREATISADVQVNIIQNKKKSRNIYFHWDVHCIIKTDEKEYSGQLIEEHTWAGAI